MATNEELEPESCVICGDDLDGHHGTREYMEFQLRIRNEEKRLKEFESFNNDPAG